MKLRVAFNDTFAGLIYSAGRYGYALSARQQIQNTTCSVVVCHGFIIIDSNLRSFLDSNFKGGRSNTFCRLCPRFSLYD